jgi:hypothetical protein
MQANNLNGLMDRVREGDKAATADFQRVLRPVVSRQVREILRTQEFASPLGQRVQGLLAEVSAEERPDLFGSLEAKVAAIAQRICHQTVARLTFFAGKPRHAADTVAA